MTFNHFSQTTSSRDGVSKSWREGSKDVSKCEGIQRDPRSKKSDSRRPDNRNQITKYSNWINQIVPN